jgi:hypothetical protein
LALGGEVLRSTGDFSVKSEQQREGATQIALFASVATRANERMGRPRAGSGVRSLSQRMRGLMAALVDGCVAEVDIKYQGLGILLLLVYTGQR